MRFLRFAQPEITDLMPSLLRNLRNELLAYVGRLHIDLESGSRVQQICKAHLAREVVVLVECQAVKPQGDPAPMPNHLRERRDA